MMSLSDEVDTILKQRDAAVITKDKRAFKATQIQDIPYSGIDGYLDCDSMTSTLVHTCQDPVDPTLVVALIRETYWKNQTMNHCGYLLYFLKRQVTGELLICDIAWSNRYKN
jgi:hypothetical protein